MIKYIEIVSNSLSDDFLVGFSRYQVTERCFKLIEGSLEVIDYHWIDEWNEEKLRSIATEIKERKSISILAIEEDIVVGFAVLDLDNYGEYLNLMYLHVDSDKRGIGIGKKLFSLIINLVERHNYKKLYISGNPSFNTIKFYQGRGCTLVDEVIPELYAEEPYDIHMEYLIK